jgi:hypothetical protein
MKHTDDIQSLRDSFGKNKDIPLRYEREILTALSYYPELKDTNINFSLALHASVPYGTKPSLSACFKRKQNRNYTITILEQAEYPVSEALLKKLTHEMRVSVLGHELAHVKQFYNCNPLSLIKTLSKFAFQKTRRHIERNADLTAIKHGLGVGLLAHANYIRSIPGYVEKRPAINTDYLKPSEIEYFIQHPQEIYAA